jgi:hypothetical protein
MNYMQKLWAAIEYGESRLPILFNTESYYSPHPLYVEGRGGGVTVDVGESCLQIWKAFPLP